MRPQRSLVFLLLAVSALLLIGCPKRKNEPPAAPLADYSTQVSTFTIGVLALEASDPYHDRPFLTKMTQIAPDEPAGWANLGVLELRNNNLDEAAKAFGKAASLAPDNADIEKLLGLLADRQGNLAEAIRHTERATQLAPADLRARYALAQLREREGTPEGEAAFLTQMQAIVEKQPDNLVAQLEWARMAAKRNDPAALQKAVGLLESRSQTFSPSARVAFQELKRAATAANIRPATLATVRLKNVLSDNPAFLPSSRALSRPDNEGLGEPITHLLKLPNPASTPAAPDTATTFTAEPIPGLLPKPGAVGGFVLNADGKNALYSVNGTTIQFTEGKPLPFPGGTAETFPGWHGVCPLDMNYDGKMDIAAVGAGGVRLYQQDASGGFQDVTGKSTLPPTITQGKWTGAWSVDIEADGDMDVILGSAAGKPTVLQNNGDGTWKPIQPFPGVEGLTDFAWADVDGDGSPDAALLDGAGKLHLFMNLRGGLFRERPLPSTLGTGAALAVDDFNQDGRLDVLLLQTDGAVIRLSDKADGTVLETAEIAHWRGAPPDLKAGTAALFAADFDNNGGLDLLASTRTGAHVWLCDEKNALTDLTAPLTGSLFGISDLNGDGRLDLLGITPDGKAAQFVNRGDKKYGWQELRPLAAESEFHQAESGAKGDRRMNSFGIGGEMELRAGLLYQKQAVLTPVVHFGLGDYAALDAVRIVWPNGDVRAEFADELTPAADRAKSNQTLVARHRLKGSCPFLFAWNGTEMHFVTDCIWRSPLGLKINAQVTANVTQTEDWVKIRGDQLVPNAEGMYDLRITAELWETHFFDHLSLMTVDHPAGTDIFVDERFSIPPPPHAIYLTEKPQRVARAVDDRGTDVTELVRERDGRYVDGFGRGDYQGITRDHWLEIELPEDAPRDAPLFLVCYGWIHPTDTSINVALGQGHASPPQGLSLETPDAQGHWTVAKPGLGFPEGKVKTILISLDGVFKPNAPRRLRLRTNLEIFWDCIQWTKRLPDAPLKTRRLSAVTAELGYRGFSLVKQADESSPELPQSYDKRDGDVPRWRDLIGFYTRFGDVRELLAKVDDRYVIMNAGDEMRLRFAAPPPPPADMVRDYVLIGDGWVKDGDYNTTFSKTVLPLPAHNMPDYTTPPGRLEDDPVYRRHPQDWQQYHTRYVTPERFRRGLRFGN